MIFMPGCCHMLIMMPNYDTFVIITDKLFLEKKVLKSTHSIINISQLEVGIYCPFSRYQWANSTSEIHKRIDF